jgi:hypothetical protein
MDKEFIEQIRHSMEEKSTQELLEIWGDNDRTEWSDEAFVAVRRVLEARGEEIPIQGEPNQHQATEVDKYFQKLAYTYPLRHYTYRFVDMRIGLVVGWVGIIVGIILFVSGVIGRTSWIAKIFFGGNFLPDVGLGVALLIFGLGTVVIAKCIAKVQDMEDRRPSSQTQNRYQSKR